MRASPNPHTIAGAADRAARQLPLVSIMVNNYNYAQYLPQAIDSALAQTYPHTEVIVVDDGSTDNSRQVIEGYGERVIPVLKENGGQASAFNAGFEACRGEIIFVLDADDSFYPNKVVTVVDYLLRDGMAERDVLVWHDLDVIDKNGIRVGPYPRTVNCSGNLYDHAIKHGYVPYAASTTSGIALTRNLASRIFPLPLSGWKYSADDTVVKAAALLGEIYKAPGVLGGYRGHGENHYFGAKKPKSKEFYQAQERFLNEKLRQYGKRARLSFFRSPYAREYFVYHRCYVDLIRLAFAVPTRHLSRPNARFAAKTILLALLLPLRPGLNAGLGASVWEKR